MTDKPDNVPAGTQDDYPEFNQYDDDQPPREYDMDDFNPALVPDVPPAPPSTAEEDQAAYEAFVANQPDEPTPEQYAEMMAALADDLSPPPEEDGAVPGWLKLWRSQEIPDPVKELTPEEAQARIDAFELEQAILGDKLVVNMRKHKDKFKAPTYIIQGLVPRRNVGLLYGASGTKKTFLALHMALCVASGVNFGGPGGLPVRPGSVLYYAPEDFAGVTERYYGWCEHYNGGEDVDRFIVLPYGMNLIDSNEMIKRADSLVASAYFQANPISMIVIDTLSANNAGITFAGKAVEENDNVSMAAMMANAEKLAVMTGAAVLILHHTGKDETRGMRGASALLANAGFAIRSHKARDGITIAPEKNKGGGSLERKTMYTKSVRLPDAILAEKQKALDGMTNKGSPIKPGEGWESKDYDSTLVLINRIYPDIEEQGPESAAEARSQDEASNPTDAGPESRHAQLTTFIRMSAHLNNGLGPSDADLQAWADNAGLKAQQLSKAKYKAKDAGMITKRAGFWTTPQSGSSLGMAERNGYVPGGDDDEGDNEAF